MLCFVSPVPTAPTTDATAHHKKFPRAMRKVLRLTSSRTKPQVSTGVDHYLQTECRVDAYFNQNLEFLDRAYDHDEFGDIDLIAVRFELQAAQHVGDLAAEFARVQRVAPQFSQRRASQ